jgi:3-hydroxyisobutyrate dehydrogenase-like beta-hydroxyacid dehydrogenase
MQVAVANVSSKRRGHLARSPPSSTERWIDALAEGARGHYNRLHSREEARLITTRPNIGFAGLGRMGRPMARQLVEAGFALTVYNRTSSVADAFAAETGVARAASPRSLAESCPVVVAMLSDGQALLDLLAGDDGLVGGLSAGDIVIDMGTSGVENTSAARRRLAEVGAHLVEATVSGSVASVESRTLLIMAAGDAQPLAGAMPVLRGIADQVIEVGGPGAGAAMKLAVNAVVFAINQAVAESLVLAERAGVERPVAYDVFASSAVAAPVVLYRRPVFEHPESAAVTFPIDLAIKDLGLILELGSAVKARLPQAETNLAAMQAAAAAGLGAADMGSMAVYLRDVPSIPD